MERDGMASELRFHSEPHREGPAGKVLVTLRPFNRTYEAEVRDLLVRCLREIAPPSAQAQLEAYITRALNGDGSGKNLGRYAASWVARRPKRPSRAVALT